MLYKRLKLNIKQCKLCIALLIQYYKFNTNGNVCALIFLKLVFVLSTNYSKTIITITHRNVEYAWFVKFLKKRNFSTITVFVTRWKVICFWYYRFHTLKTQWYTSKAYYYEKIEDRIWLFIVSTLKLVSFIITRHWTLLLSDENLWNGIDYSWTEKHTQRSLLLCRPN